MLSPTPQSHVLSESLRFGLSAPHRSRVLWTGRSADLDATFEVPCGLICDLAQNSPKAASRTERDSLVFASPFVLKSSTQMQIVLPHQVGRQFVEEVAPLVGHFAMHPSHAALRFLPAMASRLLSREVLSEPS